MASSDRCGLTGALVANICGLSTSNVTTPEGRSEILAKRAAIIFFSAMACACGTKAAGAGTALLFDATNSHVLYAEEIDTPWYPASLTKLMTAYLAFSAMRDGRANSEDQGFHLPRCLHSAALAARPQVGKISDAR